MLGADPWGEDFSEVEDEAEVIGKMSADKHRETLLRSKVVALAKAHWLPLRVIQDKNGRAAPPRKTAEALEVKHVLIREDGWTIGASTDMLEAAEGLWKDEWLGRVDFVNSECVEFQLKSSHGYWVSLGFADIETGEPCALKAVIEDRESAQPKGRTIEELREFLRRGMT